MDSNIPKNKNCKSGSRLLFVISKAVSFFLGQGHQLESRFHS